MFGLKSNEQLNSTFPSEILSLPNAVALCLSSSGELSKEGATHGGLRPFLLSPTKGSFWKPRKSVFEMTFGPLNIGHVGNLSLPTRSVITEDLGILV